MPPPLLVDFRSRGWSGSAETVGSWRNVTCQVMGASWARGSGEYRGLLSFPENNQASLTLADPERILDPQNAAGPFYGQIDVGSDIRLTFATRQVFIGRITRLDHSFQVRSGADAVAIATVNAAGYQWKLGLLPVTSLSLDGFYADIFPDENAAARVNRILGHAAIPVADRDVEAGGHMILDMGYTNARTAGSAWDELVTTMTAELGSVEIMTTGKVRTRNRVTVWETTPAATLHLGCDAHAGAIDIVDATFATLRDTVRNHVKITVEENDVYGPAEDAASQAKYGLRTYDKNPGEIRIHFDEGPTWVSYFLARMKAPLRSWTVTLRPTTQAQIDAIETLPLYTSRVHVVIDDIGGALIDLNLRPVGVEWSVDPAGMTCTMFLGDQPTPPASPPADISKYRTAITGTAGLIGYWRLGDASTLFSASDELHIHNGTYAGSPLPTLNVTGAVSDTDKSASFAGGYVDVAEPDVGLGTGDTFTVEAWIKPTTLTSTNPRGIVSKGAGAYYLRLSTAGNLQLYNAGTSTVIVSSTVTIAAGAWAHVVATKSGATVKLYVNAVDRTGTVTNQTHGNSVRPLTIGAGMDVGGTRVEFFAGGIDEVAVYNAALSLSEIAAHYTARA